MYAEKVLKYTHLPTVCCILDMVNLKEKERLAIKLVDLNGYTNEETSIKIECSVKTVYTYRKKAYKKINECLSKRKYILELLEG